MLAASVMMDDIKLSDYFPTDFKMYEYNASTGEKTSTTLKNVEDWLLAKENGLFVFQCLLCLQEMTFKTVFWKRDSPLNRSHLFTKKHKKAIKFPTVGLLFNSSKKFVMCSQLCFDSDSLFDQMEAVRRRDDAILKNPRILNQVFCKQYKFFTFDKDTCKLIEFDSDGDIVGFMKEEIKPLFSFFCLFCYKSSNTFTSVVKHLTSPRHQNCQGGKAAILSVRNFNLFVALSFDRLISFKHLKHPDSFLDEIIIATNGCIYITSCVTKDAKRGIGGEIETEFKSIGLPDNISIPNDTIRIRIPFKSCNSDSESALAKSNLSYEKSFTIYELCDASLRNCESDDLIYSLLSTGCGIYCSRCSVAIKTLDEFRSHLTSVEHASKVRKNELIGLMCYVCKLFFIELKGDRQAHIHNSFRNKKISELFNANKDMITYNTPLNKFVSDSFALRNNKEKEEFMFACIKCFDLSKKKLCYLSDHESNNHHAPATHYVFTQCKFCKVVYIDAGTQYNHLFFFREHFISHCLPNSTLTTLVWQLNTDSQINKSFDLVVNPNALTFSFGMSSTNSNQIIVFASRLFSQYVNPGISRREFELIEYWSEDSFRKYVSHFLPQTSLIFFCLKCNELMDTQSSGVLHFFKSCKKTKSTYIKFCDICKGLFIASQMEDIRCHFLQEDHISKLLAVAGISKVDVKINQNTLSICTSVFPSETELDRIVNNNVKEMKTVWLEKENFFQKIKEDSLQILVEEFPNATVKFYGSQAAGLAVNNSDFDICFDVGENNFNKVEVLLKKSKAFRIRVSLPNAKKPIFRVTHLRTGIDCDICLSLIWETHFSKLVKLLIDFDHRVHWLLSAVHYWSKETKLRNPQTLSSPAITCLVLFYLMQPDVKIIPNISYIFDAWGGRENIKKDLKLTWNNQLGGAKRTELELLRGFFHYFSILNFPKCKLDLFSGLVLPVTQTPWCLIDPFYSNNILEKFSDSACQKFQAFCYITLHSPWRIC